MEKNYSNPKSVHVLHFNDAYEAEKYPRFGAEFAARTRPDSLKIFSGDLFYPSLLSIFFKGRQMVPMLEKLAIDYGIIGNHDIEKGDKGFLDLTKDLKTKWILSNFKLKECASNPELDLNFCQCLSYDIGEIGAVKVGLFGVIDRDWLDASCLTIGDYYFIDPIEKAREMGKLLRDKGCELIFVLTHMSNKSDDDLLASDADFDICLGGHEHVFYIRKDNNKILLKSGFNFDNFTDLSIELSSTPIEQQTLNENGSSDSFQYLSKKKVVSPTNDYAFSLKRSDYYVNIKIQKVDVSKDIAPHPQLHEYIQKLTDDVERKYKKPMCFLMDKIDMRSDVVRCRESEIVNLLSDIVKIKLDVDVVFLQGGSIRSETLYPPETTFYMYDLIKMVPYMNVYYIHNVKGSDLKVLFEQGYVSLPNALGSFLHISGAAVKVNSNKEPLNRIDPSDIEICNNPYDADKMYRVAALDFISKGKDGYTKFKEVECIGLENCTVILASSFKQFCKLPNKEANRIEFALLKKHFPGIDSHTLYVAMKSPVTKHHRRLTEPVIAEEKIDKVLRTLKVSCIHRLRQYLLAEDIILKEGKWVFALNPKVEGRITIL